MNGQAPRLTLRFAEWMLRRNPFYLLSAVIMAVGARLLLVDGDDVAGDVRLIVATLSALQVYEWAVAAVLVALARSGRSPEDRPWLMLVAALFWTGPLAATVEMTIAHPGVGLALAVGVGVIAMFELYVTCRSLGIRPGFWTTMTTLACQTLVAVTPYMLRQATAEGGENEVAFFCSWWAFGVLSLLSSGIIRQSIRGPAGPMGVWYELGFTAITMTATTLHLIGMNYAFCCHARPFYAVPLLAGVSGVGLYAARRSVESNCQLLIGLAALPAIGIILSLQPFAPTFPIDVLPLPLRDTMLVAIALAFAVWMLGFVWHRHVWLLHAAVTAAALFALRYAVITGSTGTPAPDFFGPLHVPDRVLTIATYLTTLYLLIVALWRRSRLSALCAVGIHLLGFVVLVSHRTACPAFWTGLVVGWSALAALHLAPVRLPLALRSLPIIWLLAFSGFHDATPDLTWMARAHVMVIVVILFTLGSFWPWTRYRTVALTIGAALSTYHTGRFILETPRATPILVVSGAFVLLAAGGIISWHKPQLLRRMKEIER